MPFAEFMLFALVLFALNPVQGTTPVHQACLLGDSWVEMLPPKAQEEAMSVCTKVAQAAQEQDVDVSLIVALSWEESNWTMDARNLKSNCVGPLQVQPRYWCPDKKAEGCDLIQAGLKAYTTLLEIYRTPEEAVCHYNAGNVCTSRSRYFARRVVGRAARLRRQLLGSAPVAQAEEQRGDDRQRDDPGLEN